MALAMFAVCHSAAAQFTIPPENIPRISRIETDVSDIDMALQAIGVEIFRFQLPVDEQPAYDVIFHIDEYRNDSLVDSRGYHIGATYTYFNEEQGGPSERFCNSLRLIRSDINAEKPMLWLELVGAGRIQMTVEKKTEHPYGSRAFAAQPFEVDVKIPLLMYGSFWKDEKGIVRFCGSAELELDDEMMKDSPHYYIFGVELRKTGSEK